MADSIFDIADKCIAVTGGAGVLCGQMCKSLAERGAKVAVLDFNLQGAQDLCREIQDSGGQAAPIQCNVLEKPSMADAFAQTVETFGAVDVLINGAGGNKKEAARLLKISRPTLDRKIQASGIRLDDIEKD